MAERIAAAPAAAAARFKASIAAAALRAAPASAAARAGEAWEVAVAALEAVAEGVVEEGVEDAAGAASKISMNCVRGPCS